MKRRQILKAAGLLTAAASTTKLSANQDNAKGVKPASGPHSSYDVIIVGGGFSGIVAARELGKAGKNVMLVEARNRIGGRTYTSTFADRSIEFGGAWVHWLQPHVWAEMRRYGLGVVEDPFTGLEATKIMYNDGTVKDVHPDSFLNGIRDAFEKFNHDVWEIFPQPYNPLHNPKVLTLDKQSCLDRINTLDLTPDQRVQINSFMALYGGNTTDKFGLPGMLKLYACGGWNYDAFSDAESHYRIETGTAGLLQKMLDDSGADVRLATPIYRVERDSTGVKILTEDDEVLTAQTAVLTMPLNTYKHIEFAPALSTAKQQFIEEGQLSEGAKLYVHIKQNLGRVFAFCDQDQPFNWVQTHDYGDELGTILSITVARASTIDLNDDAAIQRAIQQLFPGAQVLSSAAWDWSIDPYALGAWPAYRVGQMSRVHEFRKPVERLFFAGGFTADGWHEHIDGAVESGLRVGREVQAFLGA